MKRTTTVIKFGGSLSKNPQARAAFLKQLAALARRENVVLVHGGGPEINSWLGRLGIESKFVGGLRYTDAPALEVVEMVLSGKVNKAFVADLGRLGVRAVGLSGKDGALARCRRLAKLGFVGEPVRIDPALLRTLLAAGYVPVVSSIGLGASGQALNINADSLAMAVAGALKARRLVLLTDVPGVLDAQKRTIARITPDDVTRLLAGGVITGGMIPKIRACVNSLRCGIREVWIADGAAGLKKLSGTLIAKR
jgi:acetylglutamate kinase